MPSRTANPAPRKPRRKRVTAAEAVPPAEIWTLAFVPEPGDPGQCRQTDIDRRIAELLRYARTSGRLVIVGVRFAVRSEEGGSSASNSVKHVLKHAKRSCGLRCVDFTQPRPRRSPPVEPSPN